MSDQINLSAIRRRIQYHHDRIKKAQERIRDSEIAIKELQLFTSGMEMLHPETADWRDTALAFLTQPRTTREVFQHLLDNDYDTHPDAMRRWLQRQVGSTLTRIRPGVYVQINFWTEEPEEPDEDAIH